MKFYYITHVFYFNYPFYTIFFNLKWVFREIINKYIIEKTNSTGPMIFLNRLKENKIFFIYYNFHTFFSFLLITVPQNKNHYSINHRSILKIILITYTLFQIRSLFGGHPFYSPLNQLPVWLQLEQKKLELYL